VPGQVDCRKGVGQSVDSSGDGIAGFRRGPAVEALKCRDSRFPASDLGSERGLMVPLLIQYLATPGLARENIVSRSWDRDSAQEAVELP
jgi:hypothetical protein